MHTMDFLRVIFIWSLLQCGQSHGQEALTARVSALEGKVEELESEALTRDELIRLLSHDSNSGNDGSSQDEGLAWDNRISPVTVLEVRREMMDSEVKFSVKYERDVDDVMVMWTEYAFMDDYTDNPLGDGTWETSAIVSHTRSNSGTKRDHTEDLELNMMDANFTFDWGDMTFNVTDMPIIHEVHVPIAVIFISSNGQGLSLRLRKEEGDAVETDISLPLMKIEPQGDFVYEEGKDILIKITTPPVSDDYYPKQKILTQSYLLNHETEELVVNHGISGIMELVGNKSFPDHHESTFKLKTSETKTSGFIELTAIKESEDKSALVQGLWLFKDCILRPSTQDGPFPPGYLGFVTQPWVSNKELDDGTTAAVAVCNSAISDWCPIYCHVVGDDISDVVVYKVDSDGRKPISTMSRFSEHQIPQYNGYIRQVQVKFSLKTLEGDSERFTCIATSNAFGKIASYEIVTDSEFY